MVLKYFHIDIFHPVFNPGHHHGKSSKLHFDNSPHVFIPFRHVTRIGAFHDGHDHVVWKRNTQVQTVHQDPQRLTTISDKDSAHFYAEDEDEDGDEDDGLEGTKTESLNKGNVRLEPLLAKDMGDANQMDGNVSNILMVTAWVR